ncbi:hypothetical protein [Ensifer adhaerens]
MRGVSWETPSLTASAPRTAVGSTGLSRLHHPLNLAQPRPSRRWSAAATPDINEVLLRENSRIKNVLPIDLQSHADFDFTFQPSFDKDHSFTLALAFIGAMKLSISSAIRDRPAQSSESRFAASRARPTVALGIARFTARQFGSILIVRRHLHVHRAAGGGGHFGLRGTCPGTCTASGERYATAEAAHAAQRVTNLDGESARACVSKSSRCTQVSPECRPRYRVCN